MKFISKPRGCGKTHDLIINHFLKSNALLFVMNDLERKRIIKTYGLTTNEGKRIYTWSEAKDNTMGINADFLIDNVDMFLQTYFRRNPSVVTFNGNGTT